jgi:type II secretory pathway component PulC
MKSGYFLGLGLIGTGIISFLLVGGFFFLLKTPVKKIKPSSGFTKVSFSGTFQKFFSSESLKSVRPAPSFSPGLNLSSLPTLVGIFWGDEKIALFKEKNKLTFLKPGDKIKGWEIYEITPYKVILKGKTGKKVELEVFKKEVKKKQREVKKKEEGNPGVFVVSREDIERLTANLGSLFTQIGLKPFLSHGKIAGLRISYLKLSLR